MFADEIPVEDTSTLASHLPVVGWGLLGVLALVGAWKLWGKHGGPDFAVIADRARGFLVKRGRPSPHTPDTGAAPAAQEGGAGAAPAATSPEHPAATGAAQVRPQPQHDAAPSEDETPPWLIKALVAIASVPTLLALPWAAYSVAQLLPVPAAVALPLGVLFDVAMVGAVLVALLVPSVSRQASALGWGAAGAAAFAIAVHVGWSGALVFAATPLISKALWGLLIVIRRQQAQAAAAHAAAQVRREAAEAAALAEREQQETEERAAREAAEAAAEKERAEREAALSTELTFEEQQQVAEKRREARFKLDMAAAERELEQAESEAEHQRALAQIKRLGEQQRAEDAEAAAVFEQRLRLDRQLRTLKGDAPAFLSGPVTEEAEIVPEITATVKAGFGAAAPPAFGFQRPLDTKALTPAGAKKPFEELNPRHQALVKYVHTEKEPTQRGAGKKLGRDESTIRRWKKDLEELGYNLPFGQEK